MKYIDIFLWFTDCQGMCKFCEKWHDLVFFEREEYFYDSTTYQRFFIETETELEMILPHFYGIDCEIAISGNEPLMFSGLIHFIKKLKVISPESILVLRTSGMEIMSDELIQIFDKIELSLYGSTEKLHNTIVGNKDAWKNLGRNIQQVISKWCLEKVYFQTILLSTNISDIWNIISTIFSFDIQTPIKIVYPYFIPKNNTTFLVSKSEILKHLLIQVDRDILRKQIELINFWKQVRAFSGYFLKCKY